MPFEPPENPTRDMLPRTLFPHITEPLRQYDPEGLKRLAQKPMKVLPLPDQVNLKGPKRTEKSIESKRRILSNLVQYRGRSVEGNERSLGNLPRSVTMGTPKLGTAEAVIVAEGLPPCTVPTMIPQVPGMRTLTGKYARRVLSAEEHDLFIETWNEWFTAHPEWDKPEDLDDVTTICMETVLMFRLQVAARSSHGKDVSDSYNQAFKRKQTARTNLTARRVDKVGTKSNSTTNNFNVAIVAGSITPEMEAERRRKVIEDNENTLKFLEGTVVNPHTTIDTPTADE